jgi:NAD+ diphosphatase
LLLFFKKEAFLSCCLVVGSVPWHYLGMSEIHPIPHNPLAGSPLDRAGHYRGDETWIAKQLAAAGTRFAPVWRSRTLMRTTSSGAAEAVLVSADALRHDVTRYPWAFLGLLDEVPVFAVDLSALDDPLAADDAEFLDLRRIGGNVAPRDAAIMAHARGLMHWRARHRYCGVCGAVCTIGSAGHVAHCTGCGAQHFPRTDPAVIMLVTDGDRALLGQPNAFRNMRVFTTLAGFVEPGESLEEAVAREVFEESGIRVARVRYHSSQPWPFPGSIMLGFHADAVTRDIVMDPGELADCGWFSRDQLRAPEGFVLPPKFSIARRLIEDWIKT